MAAVLNLIIRKHSYFFNELIDERVKTWPLMANPWPMNFIVAFYFLFVLKLGPDFMKNRPPYNLDKLIIVYNAIQVVCCSIIFYVGLDAWGIGGKYKWLCEPVDRSYSEDAITAATYTYYYFLLKLFDLLDTVFFVFRKKNNQITFLHVYHHTGMVMLVWGACNYYPGGHGTFVGFVNSFVHVVMYSYYLLTVAFPKYKQNIWWKKYITQIQIFQFLALVIHFMLLVLSDHETCKFPRWSAAVFLPQNFFMLILFVDFYIKAYVKKPKAKQDQSKKDDGKEALAEQVKEDTNEFQKRSHIDDNNKESKIKLRS